MRFSSQNALTASTLLLVAGSAAADTIENLVPRASMTYVACYSSKEGFGPAQQYTFQSTGWCFDKCSGSGSGAFALTGGSQCLCGNQLPPDSAKVPDSKCSTPCDGWPQAMCGGQGYYSVYTTGLVSNVSPVSASTTTGTDTSGPTKTDQTATSVSTNSGGQTVVVTQTSNSNSNSNSGSGSGSNNNNGGSGNMGGASASSQTPSTNANMKTKSSHNTAAVAAGVVVGVVGFAALAGGIFFFYRSRKQKAAARYGGAVGYGRDSQPPSMSDSRFDGDYMAQRRQSNGSIDDDHDFSRRILQVTNPDR